MSYDEHIKSGFPKTNLSNWEMDERHPLEEYIEKKNDSIKFDEEFIFIGYIMFVFYTFFLVFFSVIL